MSKHHAVEDDQHNSDDSWIHGLARAAGGDERLPVIPEAVAYYGSLVAKAPRHAAPDDTNADLDSGVEGRDEVPASARTGSLRRISAEQIDTLIGRLDDADADQHVADSTHADEVVAPDDVLDAEVETADAEIAVAEIADVETEYDGPAAGEAHLEEAHPGEEPAEDASADEASAENQTVVEAALNEPGTPAVPANSRRRLFRRPVVVGTAAALCLLAVGGAGVSGRASAVSAAAAAPASKTVAIVVDGHTETVSTLADSVAGALASAGLLATSHDSLAPGAAVSISNGSTIVLNRGRLLTLTIDGQQRQIWTTATTVDEALAEMGTRTSSWSLSANRSRPIPLTGLAVTGATLHTVGMSVGGKVLPASTTTAKTVGDLLVQHKISLGPLDTVSPATGTRLSDGLIVTIDRVVVSVVASTVTLPQPESRTVTDASIVKGTSKLVQQGRAGAEVITYRVTTINGKQTAKHEQSRRTSVRAVGTVTHIGTKSSFTYVGSEVFTNDTSFGVNWDGLAMCESTHNPKAINADPVAGLPTYGMFQFDLPTWASVGGSGNPIDAPAEEQLMRAKLLFQQRGLEPWACRDAAH